MRLGGAAFSGAKLSIRGASLLGYLQDLPDGTLKEYSYRST